MGSKNETSPAATNFKPLSESSTLFITYIDAYGPYLRFSGYRSSEDILQIASKLNNNVTSCLPIDSSCHLSRQEEVFRPGKLFVYKKILDKTADIKRIRVKNTTIHNNKLEVEADFIDYGYTSYVSGMDLLIPKYPELLQNIPSTCMHYIMLGVCLDWTKSQLEDLRALFKHQTLDIHILAEYNDVKFININWKGFELSQYLIHQKKMGAPIVKELLFENFKKIYDQIPFFNSQITFSNEKSSYNNNYISNNNMYNVDRIRAPKTHNSNQKMLDYTIQQQQHNFSNSVHYRTPYPAVPMQLYMKAAINKRNEVVYGRQQWMQPMRFYYPNLQISNRDRYLPPQPIRGVYEMQISENTQINYQRRNNSHLKKDVTQIISVASNKSTEVKRSAFTCTNLLVGTSYNVSVSFVENGPCLFCVQLSENEVNLTKMMNEIESINHRRLSVEPTLGTTCIARYSEDGQFYRALVIGVQKTGYKVSYIDYGNSALVNINDMYEIPEMFLQQEPYAMKFSLSTIQDLEPIDESLKKTFKDLVLYKNCTLTVMPVEGPPLIQFCDLYIDGKSVFKILQQIQQSRLVYPPAENLENNETVEIRYIESPKNFYVQKISNIKKFENLMDEMFTYYNTNQKVPIPLILGAPCIVKYENEWYRAEIMRIDEKAIVVRHVDFGYEQTVQINLLSTIAEQHLKLPRQAVQCCLKGFEKTEVIKENLITQFEMLAEETNRHRRSFTVNVFRIEPSGVNMVNLISKDLNVMKKLYKLNIPFERYLTFEKEGLLPKSNKQINHNNYNVSSVASSSDIHSSISSEKKGHVLSSTALSSEKQIQQEEYEQRQHGNAKQNKSNLQQRKNLKSGNNMNDCEKYSNSSSNDTRSRNASQQNTKNYNNVTEPCNDLRNKLTQNQHQNNGIVKDEKRRVKTQNTTGRSQNSSQGFPQSKKHIKQTSPTDNLIEQKIVEEFMTLDFCFPVEYINVPGEEEVILSWWVSPHQFFVQVKSTSQKFDKLLTDMMEFYKNMPIHSLRWKSGNCVIVRGRKDHLFHRARIISATPMLRRYKVFCVDTGNIISVGPDDIFKVEKRYAKIPCMAHECTLQNIFTTCEKYVILQEIKNMLAKDPKIMCSFIKFKQGKIVVNMKVNSVSLRNSLKDKGFILDNPDLAITLLKDQQIRVKISTVNSLSSFKIQLDHTDSKVQLTCSYFDTKYVKSNRSLDDKFREYYKNKTCVVEVVNVDDHNVCYLRPLVPLFKPDIQTYICTYPIIKNNYNARIVYINSLHRIHVQSLDHEEEIKKISTELFKAYEENGELLSNFGVDQICAAKSSKGNWCRARIISALKKTVELFFIDYGYTEIREKKSVKKLDKQFYVDKSSYGIEINLPVKVSDRISDAKKHECLIKMQEILLNQIINFEPIEIRKNRLIAKVIFNKKTIPEILKSQQLIESESLEYIQNLINKEKPNKFTYIETVDLTLDESDTDGGSSEKRKTTQCQQESEAYKTKKNIIDITNGCDDITRTLFNPVIDVAPNEPLYIPNRILYPINQDSITTKPETNVKPKSNPYENMEQGQLAHCDNPTQFYIHPKSNLESLRNLQENLQIISASLPPLMRIMDGANCISFYSVNKQYYRAKILDAELMVIKFIDYGNSDCVTDTTDVKEMSVFPDMDPLCIPCALPIKPKGTTDWVDAANSIFNDSYNKTIYYEFITHGNEKNRRFVNLFIDDVNVAEKLIEVGYAVPLVVVTSGELCYISHANSISDFYIQYAKDGKTLELIEIYLADYTALVEVETFVKDKIVAALFPEDGMWYRAKLLEETPDNSYKVFFIDYGNTCITPQCRVVSDTVSKVPSLSIKCSLLFDNCDSCSEATEQKFSDVIAIGENAFTIELIEPAVDHAKVNLFVGDRNIRDELEIFENQNNISELETNSEIWTHVDPIDKIVTDSSSVIAGTYINTESEFYGQLDENTTRTHEISEMLESHDRVDPIGVIENDYPGIAGTISHINSHIDFYIQLNENLSRIKEISENLKMLARDSMQVLEIGELCAACYDEDNKLRRGRILEILPYPENSARVQYVDYGNCAESSDIRILPPRFKQFHELSMHCTLDNAEMLKNVSDSASKTFIDLIKNCAGNVKIKITNKDSKPIAVEIYSAETHENLNKKLEEILVQSQGTLDAERKIVRTISTAESICHITHVDSVTSFHIQLASSAKHLKLIVKGLEKSLADKYEIFKVLEYGRICCAFIEEDDLYYRARVEAAIIGDIKIFLIDYGYTFRVKEIRKLPKELAKIPPLALHCRLNALPEAPLEQINECFQKIVEQHFGDCYQIDANEKDDQGQHVVKLQTNYKDIADELAELVSHSDENMKPVSLMPVLHKCNVVIVNSTDSFYIQLHQDLPAIERISNELALAETEFKPISDLKVGTICAALYPDDASYYRAKILKVLDEGKCEVQYIDFGNNSLCEKFYALPENLIQEQRYSKHCSLDEDFTAKDEVTAEFQTFIATHFSETFQVEFLKTTEDPYICRMFFQKKILAAELLKLINKERDNEKIGPNVADATAIRPNV